MGRRLIDRLDMPEDAFQDRVIQTAGVGGWRIFHDFDSRCSTPGFPDLVLTRHPGAPPWLLLVELKSEKGELSPDQVGWMTVLGGMAQALADLTGGIFYVDAMVWRPRDLEYIDNLLLRRN